MAVKECTCYLYLYNSKSFRYEDELFLICPVCWKIYCKNKYGYFECHGIVMGKSVTSQNYIAHYITWCQRNNFAPLNWEILKEIFITCNTNDEFKDTLDALYQIQIDGLKLSFMNEKQLNEVNALTLRLKIRLELFSRVPSGNNMLLAYVLMEEITLKKFAELQTDLNEKAIDRFDKCKALALSTKHIPERKLAFERSFELFKKFAKLEV